MNSGKIATKIMKWVAARDEQLKARTDDARFSDPDFRSDYIQAEMEKMTDEELLKVVLEQ